MKSMAFIRNTWKKKDKDNAKKAESKSPPQITLAYTGVPSTPTTFDFLATPPYSGISDHPRRPRTQSQEPFFFNQQELAPRRSPLSSSTPTLVNEWSVYSPTTTFERPSKDSNHIKSSPWKKTFHGPPQNAFHGPPDLKLYSPVLGKSPKTAGGIPPARPPRPPPLNLHPTTAKRPLNTGVLPRSATHVTFALPPNPRGAISSCGDGKVNSESYSDSPSSSATIDGTESISSEDTTRCVCSATSTDGNQFLLAHSALVDGHTSNQSLLERDDPLPLTSSPPRLAHAVMGASNPPTFRTIYGSLNTSSTPHLPCQEKELPPVPPLRNASDKYTRDSDFPLSLFPDPPPLFIRRKVPRRLQLQPKSAIAPAPQSLASTSTPLVSPTTTTTRPHTSPTRSKSYSSLPKSSNPRTIPPPLFKPPTTPLPTPPNTPSTTNSESQIQPSVMLLRTVKSTNQLQSDFLVPPVLPSHRVTTSEPSNLADDMGKTRIQSSSEGRHKSMHSRVESRLITTQTHWGYAF